jgi:hypothetical protein
VVSYNPLLLVKDFYEEGPFHSSDEFMTNADTPFLAVNNLIKDARNPWTGKLIQTEKENGVTIAPSVPWSPDLNSKYEFKTSEYLYVRKNIFDPNNWSAVSK